MVSRTDRGVEAGLEHESERVLRIDCGRLPLREELRDRREEIAAALLCDLERARRLLQYLREAPEEEVPRASRSVYRAWRIVRNRILRVLP